MKRVKKKAFEIDFRRNCVTLRVLTHFLSVDTANCREKKSVFPDTILISTPVFFGRTCQRSRMTNDRGVGGQTSRMSSWTFGPKVVVRLNIKSLNGICKICHSDNHRNRQPYRFTVRSGTASRVTEFAVYTLGEN